MVFAYLGNIVRPFGPGSKPFKPLLLNPISEQLKGKAWASSRLVLSTEPPPQYPTEASKGLKQQWAQLEAGRKISLVA